MKIALASPRPARTLDGALATVDRMLGDAAARGAHIVCFPEAWLPGLRGLDIDVLDWDRDTQTRAIAEIATLARRHAIAVIMGIENVTGEGREIAAAVIDASGALLGMQSKVQLDPSEEAHYVAGRGRRVFEVGGVRFGIAICHEGFRYPETVRWAAARGAHVVFHPQLTGSMRGDARQTSWASPEGPYYETAIMMRARENTVYVASVNYAMPVPESATCVIAPDGGLLARLGYGEEGVLVVEIDPSEATGLLARRYAPERYEELAAERIA